MTTASNNAARNIVTSVFAPIAERVRCRTFKLWNLHVNTCAILGLVLIATIACKTPDPGDGDTGYDNFQTAVASDRNYDIFWLGREFSGGGLTFHGPDAQAMGSRIGEVEGGGLSTYYSSARCDDGACSELQLVMYSRDAWAQIQAKRSAAPSPRFQSKAVEIDSRPAELRTIMGDRHPVSAQVLIVEYGRTIVEASTGALIPSTATAEQPNPLIDETTFLSVMAELRPFPN